MALPEELLSVPAFNVKVPVPRALALLIFSVPPEFITIPPEKSLLAPEKVYDVLMPNVIEREPPVSPILPLKVTPLTGWTALTVVAKFPVRVALPENSKNGLPVPARLKARLPDKLNSLPIVEVPLWFDK